MRKKNIKLNKVFLRLSGTFRAHLTCQLPDAVDELDENRRAVCIGVVFITMTYPL